MPGEKLQRGERGEERPGSLPVREALHSQEDPGYETEGVRHREKHEAHQPPGERIDDRRKSRAGDPDSELTGEEVGAQGTDGDAEMAISFLDQASDLAPDYAEPWNRRANIAYRAEDYTGAVAAIQETLKREPRHFGAMAGLGLIYEELGQQRAALEAFRAALAVHPHYQSALDGVRRLEPRIDGRDA